jgi:hypothetical protein
MGLQAQQIITLACQAAKCPGFTLQAGQFLNSFLQDLCQNYDLEDALGTWSFSFNSSTGTGSGPYALPADYLRMRVQDGKDEFYYTISGVPYPMIQKSLTEYNWLVQTPGFSSYPQVYASDLSTAVAGVSAGSMYVWPPASGGYAVLGRYFRLMPDITSPENSTTVPWFTNTNVLIRGVAGLLMTLTGDQRAPEFLGDDDERYPLGVGTILKAYLRNKEDREGAVHTVGLDRRRFGRNFDLLKNTKPIGW